jgi:trimeric autotransporter adhesin
MTTPLPTIYSAPKGIAIYRDLFALFSTGSHQVYQYDLQQPDAVTLLAGSPTGLSGSLNGIGTSATFFLPSGIAISSDGSFALVADYSTRIIRKIILSTRAVSQIGTPQTGSVIAADGIGTNVYFRLLHSVSISQDNSYALVSQRGAIRKLIVATEQVSLFAGSHSADFGNANGFGTNAQFNVLGQISINPDGNSALIADDSDGEIKLIVWTPIVRPSTSPSLSFGCSDDHSCCSPLDLSKPLSFGCSDDHS